MLFLACILSKRNCLTSSLTPGLPEKWTEMRLLALLKLAPISLIISASSLVWLKSRCKRFLLYLINLPKLSLNRSKYSWLVLAWVDYRLFQDKLRLSRCLFLLKADKNSLRFWLLSPFQLISRSIKCLEDTTIYESRLIQ